MRGLEGGEQPGITGVLGLVETHNMVINLENRIGSIDLNAVRSYFALVDILMSS